MSGAATATAAPGSPASSPVAGTADLDLSVCSSEQIHVPGNIQPHGILIAASPRDQDNTWVITQVSANIETSAGLPAESVLGMHLDDLLGPQAAAAIAGSRDTERYGPSNFLILTLAIPLRPRRTVLVHRRLGRLILELEDAPPPDEQLRMVSKAQAIITSLRRCETVAGLCSGAAPQIRQLTGYDRVMVYRFDRDGHGIVTAEDRAPEMEPFLGLRYPASDIPAQARSLYIQQRVRAIPDVGYRPVPILAAAGEADEPIDMTFCALRGVSPLHREYLVNMGVRATLAISLLQDGELWGMIIAHKREPIAPSAEVRALCDVIGQLISVLLVKVSEAEELANRLKRQQAVATLREEIEAAPSVADGLIRRAEGLMALVDASGMMIRCGGRTALFGGTPPEDVVMAMVAAIRMRHGESITHVDNICPPEGLGSEFAETASGILMMPITNDPGDAIVWFRPEVVRNVAWGGDPSKAVIVEEAGHRISPRKSFALWQEQLRGRSEPWSETDLLAVHELRRAIMAALLRQAEAQLAQLSAYDSLTGLANRRTLEAHITGWRVQHPDGAAALMFLDLDRFKTVNDSLGHAAGDEILIEAAARLRNLAPPDSVPGRLGGDEFVLFWPCASSEEAFRVAGLAVQDLSRPMVLLGRPHHTTASVGVAFSASADATEMLRDADAAMYAAKRQGGGRAVAFEPSLHAHVLSTMHLEQDLFAALQNAELAIHYQPVVGAQDKALYGFEALLRWQHPVRGWVQPSDFIPVAEDSGLIKDIGAWVMTGAIRQLAVWQRHRPDLRMSVNVSPRQLADDSLVMLLERLLESEGVPPATVGIEVTESALMLEGAVRLLHEFRALGVCVAIDDFGTGYSSLSYLNKLPMDYVKIDRSFVTPLGSGDKADRFFRAIVDLAHTLGLICIAEGCETDLQWDAIAGSGCDKVQGWIIARAMDAESAGAFVLASGHSTVPGAGRVQAGSASAPMPY